MSSEKNPFYWLSLSEEASKSFIKASREPHLEEFIFSASRKEEISAMQVMKEEYSAQVACH